MNRKIIEWSSLRMTARLRAVRQVRRWYSALTPNRPSVVTAYTATASAATAPTSAAETAIMVAPAAIETVNDQKCNQPRIRGLSIVSPGRGESRGEPVTRARLRQLGGLRGVLCVNPPARLQAGNRPGVRCSAVGVRDLLYSVYERKLSRELAGAAARPRHVAVMLD